MRQIEKNKTGEDVRRLIVLLSGLGYLTENSEGDTFDDAVSDAVVRFQKDAGLPANGIVDYDTFETLILRNGNADAPLTDNDYENLGILLDIEPAVIYSIKEVESEGRSAFVAQGKPFMVFEGHIFWNLLNRKGMNPEEILRSNPDCENILFRTWNKKYYLNGIDEYGRLEKAMEIDRESALCSASWGMFKVSGNLYQIYGKKTIDEFVETMKSGEIGQMLLLCQFMKRNKSMLSVFVGSHGMYEWGQFAKQFNGPSYHQNQYDKKLELAYRKYKE